MARTKPKKVLRGPRIFNFWGAFSEYPPVFIRLQARRRVGTSKHVEAMSDEEVAITSGLPLVRIQEIQQKLSWADIPFAEMHKFCLGCNFDPTNSGDRTRLQAYQYACQKNPQRPPFLYLRKSPHWETVFRPLIRRLRSLPTSLRESSPLPSPARKSAA
jgi:hypothetical protein